MADKPRNGGGLGRFSAVLGVALRGAYCAGAGPREGVAKQVLEPSWHMVT
jgi:hypothetical protein